MTVENVHAIALFLALPLFLIGSMKQWINTLPIRKSQGIGIGLTSQSNKRMKLWLVLVLVLHDVSVWHHLPRTVENFILCNLKQMPFFSFSNRFHNLLSSDWLFLLTYNAKNLPTVLFIVIDWMTFFSYAKNAVYCFWLGGALRNNNNNFIISIAQNSLIYDLTRFTNW